MSSRLRKYSPVERQGVNAVERIILGYYWIFREQPVSDFGIDAEVEICDDGTPTGRLVKFQIKSGSSWFRERNEYGIVFRDSASHFDYWLGHSLPVILTLYDPASDSVWWVHIEGDRVTYTGHGCKIIVPNDQLLSPPSAKHLRAISLRRRYESDRIVSAPTYVQPPALVQAIENARESVDIASPRVTQHLRRILDTAARSVRVRLLVSDSDTVSFQDLTSTGRGELHIDMRTLKDLHLKQIVIDKEIAIYGSSVDPLASNVEHLFLVRSEQLVRSITEAFEHAWSMSI